MALTELKVKHASIPKEKKQAKLADGGGLYLLVNKSGKYWRFDYRFSGKRKTASFGVYPETSLKVARNKRDEFKSLLRCGENPMQKNCYSAADRAYFRDVAIEWHSKRSQILTEKHAKTILVRLGKYVFPKIGDIPISEIEAPALLSMLEEIEQVGYIEMAHRIRSICGQVFRYAIVTGRAKRDPTADLKGALTPRRAKHMPTILDRNKIGALMRAIKGYQGEFQVQCALKIAPYVFVRPGELRKAEWSEISFEDAVWRIPAEKMKMRRPHIIPLSQQVISILKDLQPLTGSCQFLFRSMRSKENRAMSENTLNAALRRLGFRSDEIVVHGFRAMASTILHEQDWSPNAIERQLAHVEQNAVKSAYNHAQYLAERTKMMQHWADYLDGLAGVV